jgi:spore coat protein SA
MKILIIAPEKFPVSSMTAGSVETCILSIAKQLARRHQVTVVSRRYTGHSGRSVINGVSVIRVPTGSQMYYLSQVKAWLKGKSYDLIQIDNRPRFVGPIKRMLPNTPVCLFMHSLNFVSPGKISHNEAAAQLSKADLIIANSASLKQELANRFPAAASRIQKVWLGVDVNRFTPAHTEAVRKTKKAYTLLFAGRLIPRKGVDVLLRAVHRARQINPGPIKLMVAGDSPNKAYTRKTRMLSRKLGLKARFLGSVPHNRIHRIYRQADCLVCPSQGHEAFGLVNVEAMASGIPVIASDNGGIKEIIKHNRNGLLVSNYRDSGAFAQAIVRLASNRKLSKHLGSRARQDCLKRFTWRATAAALSRIYEAAVSRY